MQVRIGQVKYYLLRALQLVLGRTLVDRLLLMRNRYFYRKTGIIFIHIPKNAGTAVSQLLYGRSLGHRTVEELLTFDRQILSDRTSFAILRDPVGRSVSAWRYCLTRGSDEGWVLDRPEYQLPEFQSFERFATEWLPARNPSELDFVFRPQSDFVCDAQGDVLVDRLLTMQTLSEGLKELIGNRAEDLPVRNRNQRGKQPAEVSERAVGALKKCYARDFELYA